MSNDVLVVGEGAAATAVARHLRMRSGARVRKLYIAPGNAQSRAFGENVPIPETDVDALARFAAERVGYAFPATEAALAAGVADRCRALGVKAFGSGTSSVRFEAAEFMCAPEPQAIDVHPIPSVPEFLCLLRLLQTGLLDIADAAAEDALSALRIRWRDGFAACIALLSRRESAVHGDRIWGLHEAERIPDVAVFHAATRREGDRFLTAGERVLYVTATGADWTQASARAYEGVRQITFKGMTFSEDVGRVPAFAS